MQFIIDLLSSEDFVQLSQRLFLGQILADTQGFGSVSDDYRCIEHTGWSSAQLLQMSAARADNSLA